MVARPVTRDVDAGKPRWRRLRAVKFVRHYTNRQARLAYVRSKLVVGGSRERALRALRRVTDDGIPQLATYLAEAAADASLQTRLDEAEAVFRAEAPGLAPGAVHRSGGAVLYALVRSLRPRVVVETGTANGVSATYLLSALERNGGGELVSIDLPFSFRGDTLVPLVEGADIDTDYASPVPPGREPGWVVPDELRARWTLHLGDSRELLPRVLEDLGEIQLFFHDSLHLREHMLFEFETAWPRIARRGVLAADDVFQRRHDALPAFARSVRRRYVTFEDMGFIRKP